MRKCLSRVYKVVKTGKRRNRVCWPQTLNPTEAKRLLICGGDITVELKAINEPYYGGSSAALELEVTCSLCDNPFFKEIEELQNQVLTGKVQL